MRRTRVIRTTACILALVFLYDGALACPVCFGNQASAEGEGAKWAILFLLGVTGTVLTGVFSFGLYLRKRSRQRHAETDPAQSHQEL